jgi:hypothetical protein
LISIGILTVPDSARKFKGNHDNFVEIVKAARKRGVSVYVITTRDLHLRHPRILAYEYDVKENRWKERWIPIPPVIYNRIPSREHEQRPEVRQVIEECLRSPHTRLYNPYFFNKWHLIQWLSSSRATRRHIPETRKYSSSLPLLPLLKRHPVLYLKPEQGKAGMGIMRIRRTGGPQPSYILTIQQKRSSESRRFSSLAAMRQHLNAMIGGEDYIVQQGVSLATLNDSPFDLRVLVQKNGKGQWALTGIGARVAGESSITTHVPRGGSIDKPKKLLRQYFGPVRTKTILAKAGRTSVSIARQIEQSSGHMLGEMSMDMGVDRKGKLWFFEANSRPMKFDEPKIRRKSLQRLIDYCIYLHRKSKPRPRTVHYV